jgi:hypothetical protein
MTGGVAGAGGGAGGAALVTGGAAVGAGAGGSVTVRGGLGGATSGAGGTAALIAGAPQEGNGGLATVTGTAGVGTNRAGGAANITAGDATGNATGGSVTLTAGTSPSGTLGSITVVTGGSTRFAIDGAGAWQVGGSPGTSTNILTSNGSGTPPTWQAAPSGASGANPSAMVGLLGVNGVATTFLRSDGAPALDQNITPTWTGTHTFSSNVALNGTTTVSGTSINAAGLITSGTMATARLGSGSATANTLLHGNSTWSAVSLSADVTGNLPVANLNSGTSASSSTFWRGDATWASPGGAAITGSFTGTLTGMSGATTGTVNYSVTNGIATLWTTGAGITGTSDANTFTMTGLAGAVTPAVASSGITFAQNNSVTAFCGADVSTGGVITFNLSNVAATSGPVTFGGSLWTSSGTKGLSGAWQFSYALK